MAQGQPGSRLPGSSLSGLCLVPASVSWNFGGLSWKMPNPRRRTGNVRSLFGSDPYGRCLHSPRPHRKRRMVMIRQSRRAHSGFANASLEAVGAQSVVDSSTSLTAPPCSRGSPRRSIPACDRSFYLYGLGRLSFDSRVGVPGRGEHPPQLAVCWGPAVSPNPAP